MAKYLISRTLLYGILSILTVVAYTLLVSGAGLVSAGALSSASPVLIGLVIFFLALLLDPLRGYLREKIDRAFYRSQKVNQELLRNFSDELPQALELPSILRILREYIAQGLHPQATHIFIHDPLTDSYTATPDKQGRPSSDLHFSSGSAVVKALAGRQSPVFAAALAVPLEAKQAESARLALLGAQLFAPLPGRDQLVGWVALGPRSSGIPYTDQNLDYLDALSDQAALAIERAQVVADLENRVREMDTLARLAQGVVVTLAFDDILELIYTQTNHLIPTQDFRVALHEPARDVLYYAFYLENDERIRARENLPVRREEGLEREIIHSRRSILTDDYNRECRSRGLQPAAQGIYSWIGVPLNAGDGTIGVISLGSREPSTVFTEQQRILLQSIADQAAGAIVKAQLLEETEHRARQLAILNEVGRSLTSTLELKPLLDQILKSASEILDCEAGSLFLLDESSQELVFELTVGPVAGNLAGQRLPPGTGLVGKVIESGRPLIANDVHKEQGWFEEADKQTGFVTRDLLVVPMQVKDRPIGVIEVINKCDGSPFHMDDQELLSTFASQAAISIENARLYTQTDKALAARVEELSVLQRIDRDLNANLDASRAMHITLGWALRQSGAEAGLVGIIEEAGLMITAFQGYPQDFLQQKTTNSGSQGEGSVRLALELEAVTQAVRSGQLQARRFEPSGVSLQAGGEGGPAAGVQDRLLPDARGQLVVPIQREGKVIGALLLEGSQPGFGSGEILDFLSRLSDHAAFAISNAQLYTAVQEANRAKSDFVSFVSHELKTPMTSIKGYADLLAAGAVGPVNDEQASFLATIRSNVNRMSTLVSDLADVSRIEAGRLRLEFRAVSLEEIVEEVRLSSQAPIEGKEQTLSVQLQDGLPNVWGDATRMVQILMNLVSNAHKYSPRQGQITISAKIAAGPEEPGLPDMIHVAVKDTGFGISMEDQKRVFTKFFRSENQAIRESPGTGLGLNITRYLVEMQGGRIWFESEPGQGTTFNFTIPVAES